MARRIRDVLLVASLYDSFILAEDGQLTEIILDRYVHLNLRYAPRVQRASTGEEALELICQKSFDLIITMSHLGDMPVEKFGKEVKGIDPKLPVVQLHYQLNRHDHWNKTQDSSIDYRFLWTGDANILLASIKLIEDSMNIERDCGYGVHIILLVEDSIRFASSFLPLLYTELVKQTQSLMAEGLNTAHRLLRQAARPKIVLAKNYEQALDLYETYKDKLLGVVTDVSFDKDGENDTQAGIKLLKHIRQEFDDLPVLIQSSERANERAANSLKAAFLDKNSPTLLADLRAFMKESLGFGDFIFRSPEGEVYLTATDIRSLERVLEVAPADSIEFHARRNHFSKWLLARTEFEIADRVKKVRFEDFQSVEGVRAKLRRILENFRLESQRQVVAEFSASRYDKGSVFVKIGTGSLGGKGRGLAFANTMIARSGIRDAFDNVRIAIPSTAVICTDVFDEFIEKSQLGSRIYQQMSDEEITQAFLDAKLPPAIYADLRSFLGLARYPLAVRSSSLLEDSHTLPFAGVYDTFMLPNLHEDPAVRLDQLCDAIKLVYASVFFERSRRYMETTDLRTEEEKMAVVVQQLVGRAHESLFYPSVSGVARSYNYYPYGKAKPEDGMAYLALGLGKTVVDGGKSLRVCPQYPRQLPHFSTTEKILENSQREFYALDIGDVEKYPEQADENLKKLDLKTAMAHGSLRSIGSVYSPQNDCIYPGVGRPGVPLVTFSQLLKNRPFPLAQVINSLLELGRGSMSVPVEIEFACQFPEDSSQPVDFGFLQIRPLAQASREYEQDWSEFPPERTVIETDMVLGNGRIGPFTDIIYVDPETFDAGQSRSMAQDISRLNAQLKEQGRPYILVGPGRWGSSDEWLGIPVDWGKISAARLIVELSTQSFHVEPSQGAHFFQNLTAFRVAYMTVSETAPSHRFERDWFARQQVVFKTDFVRHLRLSEDRALSIFIDGRRQKGVVFFEEAGEHQR